MGRIKGSKNKTHISENLKTVGKSVCLTNDEWKKLGENPTRKASEILKEWIKNK